MNRCFKIVIALLLILLLSSCGTKEQPTPVKNTAVNESVNQKTNEIVAPPEKKDIKLVVKTNKAEYIQSNNIQYKYFSREMDTSIGKVILSDARISGLKDKAVEENINKTIAEGLENSANTYIKNLDIEQQYVFYFNSDVELNVDNLLSISFSEGNLDFKNSYIDGFLYRLSDGKRLYLKDLFTEGTDYVSLLNRKIIEKILGQNYEESEILSRPFTTITPDQSFVISENNLIIILQRGEAGFLRNYHINIPLSEIDNYMDLFDKQEGLDKNIYEQPYNVIKKNNIFINETNEFINTQRGKVQLRYPVITGIKNSEAEENISTFIKGRIDELLDSKFLKEAGTPYDPNMENPSANINVTFNSCGYICISKYIYGFDLDAFPQGQYSVYTIDLKTGNNLDGRDILNRYSDRNEGFKEVFTGAIKNSLKGEISDTNSDIIKKIGEEVDYSFILKYGTIYFSDNYINDEPYIMVHFDGGLLAESPMVSGVALYSKLNISPDEFFKDIRQ